MQQKNIRALAFIIRCAGAATVAYELATYFGLAQAAWAAMSAIIVSQERLHETRSFLTGRILGTIFGMGVTIAVSEIASRAAASTAMQLTIAVAICALVAREFSNLRVAMWTCPIILLTAQANTPITSVAMIRGGEVILGALIGLVFHWAAEQLVDIIIGPQHHCAAQPAHSSAAQYDSARPLKGCRLKDNVMTGLADDTTPIRPAHPTRVLTR